MLYSCNKYNLLLLQKAILSFGMILFFCITVPAQSNTNSSKLNPLLLSSFKKPAKANPLLDEYLKPSKHELMYWPNYPLTPEQIAARDRRYDRPLGQQIASDIIQGIVESSFNSLLYGRKRIPANVPKF